MRKIHIQTNSGLRAWPSIAAITFSCASVPALAIGTEEEVFRKPLQAEFNKLDLNQDNRLSKMETAADSDVVGQFEKADINHDSMLAIEEYGAFKSRIQQSRIEKYLDDSTVTAKIKAELIKDAGTTGLDISVETFRGQVILSGFVETLEQSQRAMRIASGVRGVKSVRNGLVVKG